MDRTDRGASYFPGETRHETYGAGEYKGPRSRNLGDQEMIFNTHRVPRQRQQAVAGCPIVSA